MLSDTRTLALVEAGVDRHPIDRGLLLLASVEPEWTALADVPLGERNRVLWEAAQRWGVAPLATETCPACGSDQEFPLPSALPTPTASEALLDRPEGRLRVRAVTSLDLAAAAGAGDDAEAAMVLLRRCVRAEDGGEIAEPVSEGLALAVSEALDALDPSAAPGLLLGCSDCGHSWVGTLDPVEFAWRRLRVRAERVLDEVAVLAARTGWSEAAILEMSPWRRQAYLDRAGR